MYLSSLLGKPILNKTGERVGKIFDVVVTNLNTPLPPVTGIVASRRSGKKKYFIAITDIVTLEGKTVCLSTDTINYQPFERRPDEMLLSEHILDKQIVDVKERKLTRVNDIEISESNGNAYLSSVDVSLRGILNRLGFPTWGFLFKFNTIPWQNIQFMGVDLPVKVKIDYDRLEKLHPADIARFIFQGPELQRGTKIIQSLEEGIAADVLESLPLDLQVNTIENILPQTAGKILSEMESHHAADLLSELDSPKADNILQFMQEEQAQATRELITYPNGSAGSLMKVEYVSVPKTMTIEEVLQKLKDTPKLPEFLSYIYVVESATSKKLVGVLSIEELFRSEPRTRVENSMEKSLVVAKPFERSREALKKMTQYDISAIPVVNKDHHIIGIVTLTHAIELIIPKSWQTRVILRD